MNKFITMMLTLVVMLFAANSFAWDPPTSPAPASWISDPSGVLSPEAHARLDAKLKVINQSSANEVAALVLPTLDGQDIADVGDKTAKAWGVGKKNLDNGVLVVLAMKEHKSRISTGKGVEGDLPDLKCNDILQNARPYLRKGDVEGALGFIFDSSSQAIANHKADVAAGRNTTTNTTTTSNNGAACSTSNVGASGDDSGLIFVLFLAGLGVVAWLIARSVRRTRERLQQDQENALLEMARETERMREANRKRLEEQRKRELTKATPVVEVPVVPRHSTTADRPTIHLTTPSHGTTAVTTAVAAAAMAEEEARAERERAHRAEERRRREREQEEEDRRRRQREEDDRRRSDDSSSSSSSDSGSWGGGSDSGSGGFGGGDFGGGGSSGDW